MGMVPKRRGSAAERASGRSVVMALCALAMALTFAPTSSQAAFDDPTFLMRPPPPEETPPPPRIPPPAGELGGPCGIAVNATGQLYVSDYYHDNVDVFSEDIGPKYVDVVV